MELCQKNKEEETEEAAVGLAKKNGVDSAVVAVIATPIEKRLGVNCM